MYPVHPACELFPEMSPQEFEALKASIRAQGLREPIYLWRGQILDGRHRLRACEQLGIEPRYQEFQGSEAEAVEFVLAKNLHRRHLTQSQKAALLVEVYELRQAVLAKEKAEKAKAQRSREQAELAARPRPTGVRSEVGPKRMSEVLTTSAGSGTDPARTASPGSGEKPRRRDVREQVARAYRVPNRYLSAAKRIRHQDPHLFERVRTGKASVDEARSLLTIPDERRAVVLELFASGQARTLQQAKRLMHETILQAGAAPLPDPTDLVRLERVDIREALDRIEPGSVDLLLTDPPYGEDFVDLYEALAKAAAVWLKDGGSYLVLTGHQILPEVLERMRRHLRYHWALAYVQPGPTARIWAKGLIVRWKPLLWFTKGTPAKDRVVPDLVESPRREKAYHTWGQSEAGMAELIERFSDVGAKVLDPFVGGGSTAVAAVRLHRRFIGFDIDEQALATTARRLRELDRRAAVS